MEPFYLDLPAALRGLREMKGVTQAEAAELVGVHARTWQDWERGKIDAAQHVTRIESAFDLPVGWFAAQLNVLERTLAMEARLERIEQLGRENQELMRDVLGAVRMLLG